MPNIGEGKARIVREQPARRGSDNPHSFEPTAGFRTCRICGLRRSHTIHEAVDSANPMHVGAEGRDPEGFSSLAL